MGTDLDLLLLKQREKTRKAQELYEPWMDNRYTNGPANSEYTPSPVHKAVVKHRSDYKFDEDYLRSLSPSESSGFTSGRSTAIDLPPGTPTNPTPLPTVDKPETARRKSLTPKSGKLRQPSRSKSLSRASGTSPQMPRNKNFTMFYEWVFNGTDSNDNAKIAEQLLF